MDSCLWLILPSCACWMTLEPCMHLVLSLWLPEVVHTGVCSAEDVLVYTQSKHGLDQLQCIGISIRSIKKSMYMYKTHTVIAYMYTAKVRIYNIHSTIKLQLRKWCIHDSNWTHTWFFGVLTTYSSLQHLSKFFAHWNKYTRCDAHKAQNSETLVRVMSGVLVSMRIMLHCIGSLLCVVTFKRLIREHQT